MTQSSFLNNQIKAEPYYWPHDASLSQENTALLVIDMQRDFLEEGGYLTLQSLSPKPLRDLTISPVHDLCDLFHSHNLPIYFTREGHRPDLSTLSSREHFRSRNNNTGLGIGDECPAHLVPAGSTSLGRALIRGEKGHDVIPELQRFVRHDQANVIDKPGRSAFAHTELELILRVKGIRNLLVCGVTTDVCVSSTMREGNDRGGFDLCLVWDACAAGDSEGDGENKKAKRGMLDKWVVESLVGEGGIFGCVSTVRDVVDGFDRIFGRRES